MSSKRREGPQRTRSQESLPRSLRRVRQQTKHNSNPYHQSNDLSEDSAFLSGASSFTKDMDEAIPAAAKFSARTKRGGVRPQQSTTSGMTFALVPSNDEASVSSSSSSSASTYGEEEPSQETLASLALSQAFPHDSVFGNVSMFEVDPPRRVAAENQDQTSVDSHPTQHNSSTHNNNNNNNMTLEQKAWAGIEAVLRESTNSVHREDVLSADVLRALSDSYSTFHSRATVEDPRSAPLLPTQEDEDKNNNEQNTSARATSDPDDSFTTSPTQGLTGYLGRLTDANGMPELLNSSFSSLQTDMQSLATAVFSTNNESTAQNVVVIQPYDDRYQGHIVQELMDVMVALSEQKDRSERNSEMVDLLSRTVQQASGSDETSKSKGQFLNNNSATVGFENAQLSKGKLRRDEVDEQTEGHPNKGMSKAARDNARAQQLISPRQQRKFKKPLSSSLTQSNPKDGPPVSPRRARSSSPVKMRSRSSSPAKGNGELRVKDKPHSKQPSSKKIEPSTAASDPWPGEKRRGRRHICHDEQRMTKNGSKSLGEISQETQPIDFDASLPSGNPRNIATRRIPKTPVVQNAVHRDRHPVQFDAEDSFFSPVEFTNANAILTPKDRNRWPSLLVESPKEGKLNNSMPSLVTLNESELTRAEAAQAKKWASFGDLGLDEMFLDGEDELELVQAPVPTASPKRRGGRRRRRFHHTNQHKSVPRKKLVSRAVVEETHAEEDNGVEAFVNYFRQEEQISSSPAPRLVQQSSGLLPSLQRFRRSPRRDRKKTVESINKGGPLSKLKKGMGSLLCRNKKSLSTPNSAKIDTGLRDAQFYPDMEDDRDESGYGNLLD